MYNWNLAKLPVKKAFLLKYVINCLYDLLVIDTRKVENALHVNIYSIHIILKIIPDLMNITEFIIINKKYK